ncbi:hypothetical protein NEF87_003951 [Candidatus Lokiarchaeum ossiferum]|uniref:Uncharacterized protein n=1 Tax=Candidatus Lokiarchaeum ossiferum TaxID=2951803 RepID=A0ABY6HVW7_9ARCH|nr:hypothetical protein NEF87_003951 [Candidatus Lokiarchaeum sp. B-35]
MNSSKQIQKTVKITLIMIWISSLQILVGSQSVKAETENETYLPEEFIMQQNASRLYLTDLTMNDTWFLNCTAKYQGIFYLYLYNARPTNENFLTENTEYPEIGGALVAYNETPTEVFSAKLNDTVHTITLEYKAPADSLYYLEIRLIENGPDTFVLKSKINNQYKDVQAYYIPFIPGYPSIFIITTATLTIIILRRKAKQNLAKRKN